MAMLLLFIDGVGVGSSDPAKNPFAFTKSKIFNLYKDDDDLLPRKHSFLQNGWIKSIDCSMDVEGLPQSASGQTALFTGVNTAKLLGRHLSGFPNRRLKKILAEQSTMVELERKGFRVIFANAFHPVYFEKKITRVSATTAMAESCQRRIRNFNDLENGNAVFMDLTNQYLIDKGFWVTARKVEEAGSVLAGIVKRNDFTLFEYFITDVLGHRGDMNDAIEQARRLDKFISVIWENLNQSNDVMIITSDHGNIECNETKTHTANRIPLIVAGNRAEELIKIPEKITDVKKMIDTYFNK
ncbi:MAG: alkaline phosphatase family protein [Acidobacteria bacterium]|nr:alkaline phosphatase family protein [Acidobacteriota bacterium]